MMTENFLYFQHRNGTFDFLVNATEFRTLSRGTFWSVVIINANGHHTYNPPSREEAERMAKQAVATMVEGLWHIYCDV